jgi:acetyl-CoA synthetase
MEYSDHGTKLNKEQYQTLYKQSIQDPEDFWAQIGREFITWQAPFKQAKMGGFEKLDMRWFIEGKLNACYNAIDRHLTTKANQLALIWQADDPQYSKTLTYAELHLEICRFANVLKKYGVKKGDRIGIYMPMIPEVVIAMLACARIGAVHSVVFPGFSSTALRARILDADCHVLITADAGIRGNKMLPLKLNTDEALEKCPNVKHLIVIKHKGISIPWHNQRDIDYLEEMSMVSADCPIEIMDSEDPLFILYTSGSTGNPKGILHNTAGYLVYVAMTYNYIFDYQQSDIYWCTADVGWITGHSYVVYGPLCNGATTLMYEGLAHYPNFSRYWEIVDKFKVNILYTAPTAIRSLRREGDGFVTQTSRKSLKLLASLGEPINPDVWTWYSHVVGEDRCPVIDTWWQTETGGIMISPLPHATTLKPGSVTLPLFGIVPEVVDDKGCPSGKAA